MITKTVQITTFVEVTVDETKFTEEFMEDFRSYMMPYDCLDEHIIHIAEMHLIDGFSDFGRFLEGYGDVDKMGIKTRDVYTTECEILND